MITGSANSYPDLMEWHTIMELCPAEAAAMQAVFRKYGITDVIFAQWRRHRTPTVEDLAWTMEDAWLEGEMAEDDPGHRGDEEFLTRAGAAAPELLAAWGGLQRAFEDATQVGDSNLTLHVSYYDSADEDQRDGDVDRALFCVGGAYQLSPAGQQFKSQLTCV